MTHRLLTALCLAALANGATHAQGTFEAPALGALPGQAKVVNFTPLAEQAAPTAESSAAPAAPAAPAAKRPAAATKAVDASRIEHALFDRRPVAVELEVGAERLVRLPWPAMLELPPDLDRVLEAQLIEDTVYLTALGPIKRSRALAHALDGAGVIPLDLSASTQAAPRPELAVHLPGAGPDSAAEMAEGETARPDMVALTRFAAQAIYAPRRLLRPLPGIRQSPVAREPLRLYRDTRVETAPLGAWTSGELFVTAVRFSNAGSSALELDMERLRGRWIAATPQHWRLHPRGSEADTTVVYLVSEHAFDAMRED